jgi:alkaline phosphatase D
MRTLLLLLAVALAHPAFAASGRLVSGPMLGYQSHREALIWLEAQDATRVELRYQIAGRPESARTIVQAAPAPSPAGTQPMKFVLPLLELGQRYEYALQIDGVPVSRPYPLAFRTTTQWEWRTDPPEFSFLFGTCAYFNDSPYDRPGKPYGAGTEIFRHMAARGADFMIWGGDNLYLREADYSSESGIWYRYSHDRATPDLQPLLAAMPHYATWDDHDYGPNDSNRSFEFKGVTTAAFKAYWGNPSWAQPGDTGIYGKFYWGDAAFFLLDNRTHRDDTTLDQTRHPAKTQYGARQLDWLKQSLLSAKVLRHFAFKFIVTGSQFLPDGEDKESAASFRREREELLRFITDEKITGVIFLTGDVHFTELNRQKIGATQWVYELTSSPLTSGSSTFALKNRMEDPMRVPGSLVVDQNFCRVTLGGPANARSVAITCFDKTNTQRWSHTIRAEELR